jgi:hypothetical protein
LQTVHIHNEPSVITQSSKHSLFQHSECFTRDQRYEWTMWCAATLDNGARANLCYPLQRRDTTPTTALLRRMDRREQRLQRASKSTRQAGKGIVGMDLDVGAWSGGGSRIQSRVAVVGNVAREVVDDVCYSFFTRQMDCLCEALRSRRSSCSVALVVQCRICDEPQVPHFARIAAASVPIGTIGSNLRQFNLSRQMRKETTSECNSGPDRCRRNPIFLRQ